MKSLCRCLEASVLLSSRDAPPPQKDTPLNNLLCELLSQPEQLQLGLGLGPACRSWLHPWEPVVADPGSALITSPQPH